MKNENLLLIKSMQGRQSIPKSGRSERGRQLLQKPTLKGYFCFEQGLPALNFLGGAEKVVVHMHWLTLLLWRP